MNESTHKNMLGAVIRFTMCLRARVCVCVCVHIAVDSHQPNIGTPVIVAMRERKQPRYMSRSAYVCCWQRIRPIFK